MSRCEVCGEKIKQPADHSQCRKYRDMLGLKEAVATVRLRLAAGLWP